MSHEDAAFDADLQPAGQASPGLFAGFDHLDEGARFFRADLHVHSYGGSSDVKDNAMTVDAIVATAIERKIDLLAITDHNAICAVTTLIERARSEGLAVLCGVEISATEGHLLVYFDAVNYEGFAEWFGAVRFEKDDSSGDRWTLTPMHQLIADVAVAGGVAIPAHVGRQGSGFAMKAVVKSQDAIAASPGVLAVEVDGEEQFDWFSPSDTGNGSSERLRQLQLRASKLGLPEPKSVPKVRFSDAHRLDAIGRNRDGQERLTRFKMATPGFEGFRTALLDADARVKLEDSLPQHYPRILGARFVGGFLDGQELRFSSNLTCLIGGRGTGKSTALNSVRCACLNDHDQDADAANRPQTLQLVYEDGFGARHYLQRDSGGRTVEVTSDGVIESTLEVDGYAQNRVTEITTTYPEDPGPLLAFLDGFADLSAVEADIAQHTVDLRANAEQCAPVADAAARLMDGGTRLKDADNKLAAVEESSAKVAFEWKLKLDRERLLRRAVSQRLAAISASVAELGVSVSLESLAKQSGIEGLEDLPSHEQIVGTEGDKGLAGAVYEFATAIEAWRKSGEQIVANHDAALRAALAAWEARDQQVETRFQQVVAELAARGISPDLSAIDRLLKAQADAKDAITKANADLATLASLKAARASLLSDLRAAQGRRFHVRGQALARISRQLNTSVAEFKVKIGFVQGHLLDGYEAWLRAALENRFFRSERLTFFCRTVHPMDLAKWIRTKNSGRLSRLVDGAGNPYFGAKEAAEEFIGLVSASNVDALEVLDVSDRPTITLTTDLGGTPHVVAFENLSLGQKASVLLGALLFAEDTTPLIVDQPEDHLDSRFIFGTVVTNLRHVKEKRQVILATHNANIAILGDAEMIVPLQGWKGKGVIREPGSVDGQKTRKRACDILEGGTTAYTRRGEMYGLLDPAVRRPASRTT